MGWFSGLIGGGSSVVEPVVAIGNVIDKLFTSDDERAAGELLKQKLERGSPDLPLEAMMELTIAMLGLAGLRTVEKLKGVAK